MFFFDTDMNNRIAAIKESLPWMLKDMVMMIEGYIDIIPLVDFLGRSFWQCLFTIKSQTCNMASMSRQTYCLNRVCTPLSQFVTIYFRRPETKYYLTDCLTDSSAPIWRCLSDNAEETHETLLQLIRAYNWSTFRITVEWHLAIDAIFSEDDLDRLFDLVGPHFTRFGIERLNNYQIDLHFTETPPNNTISISHNISGARRFAAPSYCTSCVSWQLEIR
jgi:hypothetical protein